MAGTRAGGAGGVAVAGAEVCAEVCAEGVGSTAGEGVSRVKSAAGAGEVATHASRGTVFFDYDGTLHDSMAIYGPAFRAAYAWLVDEGHMPSREFTDEWISQWLGFTTEAMWTTFAPELPEAVWREAAALVGREMDRRTAEGQARLFPGVVDILETLKERGYDLVFLSNCRTRYCEVHRATFGLDAWFGAYCCAEDFDDIPKWQIYERVAGRYPRPHAMVGDRFHDLEVASRAGIPSVGCAYGFGRPGELDSASAIVASPAEVPDVVARLLG